MFFRLVNPDHRFVFENYYLDTGGSSVMKVGGMIGGKAEVAISVRDGQVYVTPQKGDTLVNDVRLEGEHALGDGDKLIITEKKKEKSRVLQLDPVKEKKTRREKEMADGVERSLPDMSEGGRYVNWFNKRIRVDENGLAVKKMGWKEIPWAEIDQIIFVRQSTGAAAGGGLVGAAIGAAIDHSARARGEGEFDELFGSGMYTATFMHGSKRLHMIQQMQARTCALLGAMVEYYAPMDLIVAGWYMGQI